MQYMKKSFSTVKKKNQIFFSFGLETKTLFRDFNGSSSKP